MPSRSNRISQLDRVLMGEDCEKSHTGLRESPQAATLRAGQIPVRRLTSSNFSWTPLCPFRNDGACAVITKWTKWSPEGRRILAGGETTGRNRKYPREPRRGD